MFISPAQPPNQTWPLHLLAYPLNGPSRHTRACAMTGNLLTVPLQPLLTTPPPFLLPSLLVPDTCLARLMTRARTHVFCVLRE